MTHMMDFPRRVMSLWVQFDQKQLIIMLKCHVPFSLIRLEAIMLTELLFKKVMSLGAFDQKQLCQPNYSCSNVMSLGSI
jgi:hypothetical protein